jgi:hypothetical protein
MADSKTEKEALIRDFPEVTEIPKAQIPVKEVEHVIETTKDPPFGPIYCGRDRSTLPSLEAVASRACDRCTGIGGTTVYRYDRNMTIEASLRPHTGPHCRKQ